MQQEEGKFIRIQLVHQSIGRQLFDIQTRDNMSQFRSTLTQTTPLALYENYYFLRNNKKISEYQEVAQAFQLDSDYSSNHCIEVKVNMQPFKDRSSRYHFTKVKKILKHPAIWAVITNKDNEQKILDTISILCQNQRLGNVDLEHLFDKPLTSHLIQPKVYQKSPELVRYFNYSGFDSPPYFRKLAGDFYYLILGTLEGVDYHITANPQGFFLNSSTGTNFNPTPLTNPTKKPTHFTSLLQLLMSLSPKFCENFHAAIKGIRITQLDRVMNSCLLSLYEQQPQNLWMKQSESQCHVYSWPNENVMEENLKHVDHNTIKDWNQLFQMQAMLPSDTLLQRLNKDKMKYKLYQEFVEFAKSGAISIVQQRLAPINITRTGSSMFNFVGSNQNHIYTLGAVLFTITQESPYSYSPNRRKQSGNIAAPTGKQADNSLRNLAIVERLAIPELYLAHMVVIKYRGFKILVQCMIPGSVENALLTWDQIGEEENQNDRKMEDSVKKLCRTLQISEQISIIGDNKVAVKKMVCSPPFKVLKGSDKRKYLSGLMGLSPKDYNYPGTQNESCVLRPQILQIYKQQQKCTIPINPVLGRGLQVYPSQKIKFEQQKLRSIAKFAKQIVVPMFINSICNQMRRYLSDTKGVMFVLHKMGLSSRYLGLIYTQASDADHPHLKLVVQRVILVKTLKNIFRLAMRQTDLISLKSILVRMLNCIFGSQDTRKLMEEEDGDKIDSQKDGSQEQNITNHSSNIHKKKKKKSKDREQKDDSLLQYSIPTKPSKYSNIKPNEFWEIIKKVAMIRYSHKLPDKIDDYKGFSSEFKFNKLATLRDICLNLGLVLERKQYLSKQRQMFTPSDILQFKPLCKHIPIQCKDLLDILNKGDKCLAQFQVEQAIESYNKGMQYIMTNFGGQYQKLAMVHKKLSNIYFRIGQIETAILFASHSCYIFQSIQGPDHIETIQNYSMLAFYHYSKRNFQTAERFMLKSIHLNYTAYGECYPELIIGYLNLSTVYESQKKFTDAIMSIVYGLNLAIKIFGREHIHVAICYSALATLHYQIPDIQQSIKYQLKAVETLSHILNDEDSRTKQSKSVLQYYRTIQSSKKVKEVHQKEQRKLQKLYSGMQLFRMPEPSFSKCRNSS